MAKNSKYRVYIGQVNQTYVEVSAKNEEEALEKGYRQWKKDWAHSEVRSVEEIKPEKPASCGGNCKVWPSCPCIIRGKNVDCQNTFRRLYE